MLHTLPPALRSDLLPPQLPPLRLSFRKQLSCTFQRNCRPLSLSISAQSSSAMPGELIQPATVEPLKDAANPLLTPYQMGPFKLSNRMVFAPLTRCRAIGQVPQPAAAEYYGQRSHGNLIINEATPVAIEGHGYVHTPGIHTAEQVEAWKPIVKAVKDAGSVFFLQLWHVGRVSHSDYQPNDAAPLSSTNRPVPEGDVYTLKGAYKFAQSKPPRALREDEIPSIVEQFRIGARNSIEAGFDGVEVHGAHGYLIDQFLKDGINDRTDKYGGSIENRCRFALEVVEAVVKEVGADRTGIRLSPFTEFYGATDSDPYALMEYLLRKLNDLNLVYVHMVEPRIASDMSVQEIDASKKTLAPFRKLFKNTFIAAGGYTLENGIEAIKTDHADLIAYGRIYLANPDLPKRFELNAPLNKYDRSTFYTQDQVVGYTDYPSLTSKEIKALSL